MNANEIKNYTIFVDVTEIATEENEFLTFLTRKIRFSWLAPESTKSYKFRLKRLDRGQFFASETKKLPSIDTKIFLIVLFVNNEKKEIHSNRYEVYFSLFSVFPSSKLREFSCLGHEKMINNARILNDESINDVFNIYSYFFVELPHAFLDIIATFLEFLALKKQRNNLLKLDVCGLKSPKLCLTTKRSQLNAILPEKSKIIFIPIEFKAKELRTEEYRIQAFETKELYNINKQSGRYNQILLLIFINLVINLMYFSKNGKQERVIEKIVANYKMSSVMRTYDKKSTRFFFINCKRTAEEIKNDNEDLSKNYNKIHEKEPLTFWQKLTWIKRIIMGNERRWPPESIEEIKNKEEKNKESKEETKDSEKENQEEEKKDAGKENDKKKNGEEKDEKENSETEKEEGEKENKEEDPKENAELKS